jgi:NAD(P)-dependent dehydrogenase (short-subunit alcohol dehydrogenase family)
MNSLAGKVAIVTGGASGIGKAVAEVFAEAGLTGLTIADIDGNGAQQVASDVTAQFGTTAIALATDVAEGTQVEAMVQRTVAQFERVDILVNNAGIAPAVRWAEVTEENWRRVMDVNLNGAFLCTLAVLPFMKKQQAGRIVNISSVGAFLGSVCAHPAYGASKAAMIAMTKSLAKEFASDGILVNAIAPGSIDTPMALSFGEAQKEQFIEAAPLKRQGTPRELADAVWYLVSDRSTYVTGTTLHVNGGSLLV